jgi:beta-alanine--pyruvate transaminase
VSDRSNVVPNDLNAVFGQSAVQKKVPHMFVSASDMHYVTADGKKVLDRTTGLWWVNAGHCRPRITEAVRNQVAELDYAPAFRIGHPKAFELANRLVDIAPEGLEIGRGEFR